MDNGLELRVGWYCVIYTCEKCKESEMKFNESLRSGFVKNKTYVCDKCGNNMEFGK